MTSWEEIRRTAVVFEDETVLVVNKPAGVSVMGERHGTDLVRMAAEAGETLFPVHRIDKVTSGLVLFARELRFHGGLTRQFQRRTVDKTYLAITRATGLPGRDPAALAGHGAIDLPLRVGRKNRVRVAAHRSDIRWDACTRTWSAPPGPTGSAAPLGTPSSGAAGPGVDGAAGRDVRTYPSVTRFARVWDDGHDTLLAVSPLTGRRHQIRVHLAWIGHPILGDPLFPSDGTDGVRACLHSWRLSFDSAGAGERVHVLAPPGPDFWHPLAGRLPIDLATCLDQACGLLDRT